MSPVAPAMSGIRAVAALPLVGEAVGLLVHVPAPALQRAAALGDAADGRRDDAARAPAAPGSPAARCCAVALCPGVVAVTKSTIVWPVVGGQRVRARRRRPTCS